MWLCEVNSSTGTELQFHRNPADTDTNFSAKITVVRCDWQKHQDLFSPFSTITLFDFLSLKTDPSHHRWDKMSKKTKLLLKDTVRYALERRESKILTSPLTTLTTSCGTPGTGSWIPKTRAKDRAIEGHIYISTAGPMFRESRGRQRSYRLLKNEWCLFD